jgi:hypothetical protein
MLVLGELLGKRKKMKIVFVFELVFYTLTSAHE